MVQRKGWKPCPGCGIYIVKCDGCDHVIHQGCPGARIKKRGGIKGNIHMCYKCGKIRKNCRCFYVGQMDDVYPGDETFFDSLLVAFIILICVVVLVVPLIRSKNS